MRPRQKRKCYLCNRERWRRYFLKVKGKFICYDCLMEIEKDIQSEENENYI